MTADLDSTARGVGTCDRRRTGRPDQPATACTLLHGASDLRGRATGNIFAIKTTTERGAVPIPRSQLQTWSNHPDPGRSAETYKSIKKALDASSTLPKYEPDIYLQGSYANATNIRADSDVDIVVQLTASFRSDTSALTDEELRVYRALPNATLTLQNFRSDVLAALRKHYGEGIVTPGKKCLKVAGSGNRLPADVLPCQEYRLWRSFLGGRYEQGIIFQASDGRHIINYPKQHRKNGEVKHGRTGDRYKGLVRTVKNARRELVRVGRLVKGDSPSYFVECLLFNIPDPSYSGQIDVTYLNVLTWLYNNRNQLSQLKCQNGITDLFGDGPEQWDTRRAARLINALITQWNDWGK